MFRKKKPKDQKISKSRLLRAIKRKATVLGDACRTLSHPTLVISIEDLEKIVREIK